MKFFALIMATLILGLSVLPCMDSSFKSNAKNAVVDVDHHDGDSSQEHTDNCSPLCICSCCSVVSVYSASVSVDLPRIENHIEHASYYSGSLISISLPVWQPPQLAA